MFALFFSYESMPSLREHDVILNFVFLREQRGRVSHKYEGGQALYVGSDTLTPYNGVSLEGNEPLSWY